MPAIDVRQRERVSGEKEGSPEYIKAREIAQNNPDLVGVVMSRETKTQVIFLMSLYQQTDSLMKELREAGFVHLSNKMTDHRKQLVEMRFRKPSAEMRTEIPEVAKRGEPALAPA